MPRRNFIKRSARLASGTIVLVSSSKLVNSCILIDNTADNIKAYIPMPIQVVIDDVGWWSGEDGSKKQEPYRTGINRKHVPADYLAIADLGRILGIRPQAAFILCEWDKENILREVPTSTWMGNIWNNSKNIGPWLDEAAEIIRSNRDHLELTLHGIGHEYWENGIFTRAEWTDSTGQMRPQEQVEKHLEYFEKLMDQHNLGPFPKSFVPAAFRHSFGPSTGRDISLAELLNQRGINYINTPFSSIYHKERIQYELFGFDDEVMTIDRGNDEFSWLTFPADPKSELTGPTCGMHWPNLLHPDPARNVEIVEKWVNYLKPYDERADKMLASDSVSFQHQLAHHKLTRLHIKRNSIHLDFTDTDKLPGAIGKRDLIVKIKAERARQFKSEEIEIVSQSLQPSGESTYILKLKRKEGNAMARIKII